MAHLLSDLANFLNLEETNIDNWTFKLYYKVSMVSFILREALKNCVFYGIVIIRETTYPPSLIMT